MIINKDPNKILLLTMSDHPLVASGVGTQTRYVLEGLLKTGKFQILSLGGALKHADYRPLKVQEFGDDWVILPIDGYGNEQILRDIMDNEQVDAIFFVTDPRFYMWLFNMSDEIRDRGIPLCWWTIWDELPVPNFNKPFYDSCDFIGCISKLTNYIIESIGHKNYDYIPHAVDPKIFKPVSPEEKKKIREKLLGKNKDKFIYFYNSRNARRKMTSDVVRFFKETLDIVGQDKAFMLMHTDPHDQEGANLLAVCELLKLKPDQITFSTQRIPPEVLAELYQMSDTTVCLSNNEGFGLSNLESLMCGTPVIAVRTGGLQDQNIDKDTGEQYGVSIYPKTKSLTGSQPIPYIYDCRCTDEDILNAYLKMFNLSKQELYEIGQRGCQYVNKEFKLDVMIQQWYNALVKEVEKYKNGSPTRIKFTKI